MRVSFRPLRNQSPLDPYNLTSWTAAEASSVRSMRFGRHGDRPVGNDFQAAQSTSRRPGIESTAKLMIVGTNTVWLTRSRSTGSQKLSG